MCVGFSCRAKASIPTIGITSRNNDTITKSWPRNISTLTRSCLSQTGTSSWLILQVLISNTFRKNDSLRWLYMNLAKWNFRFVCTKKAMSPPMPWAAHKVRTRFARLHSQPQCGTTFRTSRVIVRLASLQSGQQAFGRWGRTVRHFFF